MPEARALFTASRRIKPDSTAMARDAMFESFRRLLQAQRLDLRERIGEIRLTPAHPLTLRLVRKSSAKAMRPASSTSRLPM